MTQTEFTRYDAVILGGGLAGLALAVQLKQARPQMSVLIVERNAHPVREAAHKVGEASIETSAHYFAHMVGMEEHLKTRQLPKMGLRFFMPAGDNSDIARRVEIGERAFLEVPTYQLDRGRFENALAVEAQRLGAEFLDGCKVKQIALGSDGQEHTVQFERGSDTVSTRTRWLLDASGRSKLIQRRLGLARPVGHDINAAWFRISEHVDIDDWSTDPAWQARVPARTRRFSTNHLLGLGYWVWLIPLASGSHSIGICADQRFYPFDEINTFERALQWLRQHEPQVAQEVEARRDQLQDFRVLKHFAYSCDRFFSTDRWCLTGEAGQFVDPLYSFGSDLIAIANTFITDLVTRELDGEDVSERLEAYNFLFSYSYDKTLKLFEGQYHLFANAQVEVAKVAFDIATYWGFVALLFFRNKLTDLDFVASVLPILGRLGDLNERVQGFFREWDELDRREWRDAFVDTVCGLDFLHRWHHDLLVDVDDEQLRTGLANNLGLLEAVAVEMFRKAAPLVADLSPTRAINPYALSLKPERWEADGLFSDADGVLPDEQLARQLEHLWLDRLVPA